MKSNNVRRGIGNRWLGRLRFRGRRRIVESAMVLVTLVATLLVPLVQRADATSPGANGKIAFITTRDSDGNGEVYVMNADGSGPTRLTINTAFDTVPSWSPDGSKIAFGSNLDGNDEIYVMNADGSGQTRLTFNPAFDSEPSWSPDGSKITFMSNRDGNLEVHVMNADGSGQTRLTTNSAVDSDPSWSPDGSKIAFSSQRDGVGDVAEIYVMNADGSSQTRLTTNSASDFEQQPSWSPDGRKIAFTSTRDGNNQIYVMNADGSGPTRLTTNSTGDFEPSWSPDGSKISFTSTRDLHSEIYVMNADGSGQTRLTTTNNVVLNGGPDWQTVPSADLALAMAANPNQVKPNQPLTYTITVTNFGPSNAFGVVVTDVLPPDARFVSAAPSKGTCHTPPPNSTGTVTCTLGFLSNSGSQTAQVTVKFVLPDTTESNTASVASTTPDPNPGNNSATIAIGVTHAQADLSVSIGASPSPVKKGTNLTYTTTVRNLGPDPATGVTLTQKLPSASQFVSATPSQGSCTMPKAGGTGSVSCSVGSLPSGATATLKVVVRVIASSGSSVSSTSTAASSTPDPNSSNNKATATTKVCGLFCG